MTVSIVTIGSATLYLGDAYQIRPTLGWMDADVLDPPFKFRAAGAGSYRKNRDTMDQILEEELNEGFDHTIINPLLCGAAVVFCHNDQLAELLPHLDGNFERYAVCLWRKANPQPVANKHYRPVMEFYVHAWSAGHHPQGSLEQLDPRSFAIPPEARRSSVIPR